MRTGTLDAWIANNWGEFQGKCLLAGVDPATLSITQRREIACNVLTHRTRSDSE